MLHILANLLYKLILTCKALIIELVACLLTRSEHAIQYVAHIRKFSVKWSIKNK